MHLLSDVKRKMFLIHLLWQMKDHLNPVNNQMETSKTCKEIRFEEKHFLFVTPEIILRFLFLCCANCLLTVSFLSCDHHRTTFYFNFEFDFYAAFCYRNIEILF